ncbi:MAG: cytochrome c biogenesis protein ResB [Blastocatellia bacterium]|nr:cytochrome c biogenesis protein ResB [Blastocatellia bacterium]
MTTSRNPDLELSAEKLPAPVATANKPGLLDRILRRLSSVPFGISMLILLILMSMTGMLIMQINVDGFDKYYASLTPSKQIMYTDPIVRVLRNWTGAELRELNILSLVDIYRSWTFIALLAVLSLNIVLASIDHFPGAWRYVRKKKLSATRQYAKTRDSNAVLPGDGAGDEALRVAAACRSVGMKPTITHEGSRATVFAERNGWNRLGAYFVHVGLLTIFVAGFATAKFSFNGSMTLQPGGESATIQGLVYDLDKVKVGQFALPFLVECTDIQQTLIRKEGSLEANNTVDWFTRIRITDQQLGQTMDGDVHMNKPVDYRGYRFFQSSYQPVAKARAVTLDLTPMGGQTESVTLMRGEVATLADGTKVRFADFMGNSKAGPGGEDYTDPVARVQVLAPGATEPASVDVRPASATAAVTASGLQAVLTDFEKVGASHTLSVQYDPGAWIFYIGSVLLIAALSSVFFASHQRVWVVMDRDADGQRKLFVGGHTNRNRPAFGRRSAELVSALGGPTTGREEKS